MRWIWIDQFIEFNSGHSARAVKNLTLAEDHFRDHFPGYPVMPMTLMIEGLAQTGGILAGEAGGYREKVVLAKIQFARFRREAFAGEILHYTAEMLSYRPEGALVGAKAWVADGRPDELLGEAEIFFAHLDQSRTQRETGEENFVFTSTLRHLLRGAKVTGKTETEPVGKPAPT
jgi:3-hydroxyacyl-[acyl-carrier-protein] dehydratase